MNRRMRKVDKLLEEVVAAVDDVDTLILSALPSGLDARREIGMLVQGRAWSATEEVRRSIIRLFDRGNGL